VAEETSTRLRTGDHQVPHIDVLRWLYTGRLTLVTGILAGAFWAWFEARPDVLLVTVVMFLVALFVTSASFWYTHLKGAEAGENFLYAQVVFDVILVTAIVHVTLGPESTFAPLYILVISVGALMLPLPGGVLIGALASISYFADLVWGFQETLSLSVVLQIGLFTLVALITGQLGDRLRHTGLVLGAMQSELEQLRLDTSDILANLATGVLTVDGEGRLAYANLAAEELLGLDRDAFMGRPVLAEVERIAPGLSGVLEGSIHHGKSVGRFRTTATLPDSRKVRLGVSTAVLERSGKQANSATAIFQDITDLERIDELHIRTQRFEAVAALSASLAHEIKNPLASIRSSAEQLSGHSLALDDRGTLERLVLAESDRLSRLLSEFLDYSVMKIGAKEAVDLRSLVNDCISLSKLHPDFAAVDLVAELHEGPVRVMGDGDLLHRALFNLLLNGAQSAGAGGRVVVSLAATVEAGHPFGIGFEYPVRLAIRDSGPGIDAEDASRVFDPFYTTKESGSGLGLAVVHRAVEAHQGVTFVDRAPEGGARFVIFLPGIPGEQSEEET
jgi:two-component system sensor histidine kinase PilS (NtrC family)